MKNISEETIDKEKLIKEKSLKESFATPKVSIIVPVFNTEKYIFKCILSLISQTLREIEIIIIDDGSTDNTLAIIQKFAQEDARIKIIKQENQKQGAARNRGMEIATGEYVGFVDSDDWVDEEYFEQLYNGARKYDSDIALGTNVRIGNGKTKKRLNIEKEEFVTSLQDKIDISHQAKNPCPTNKIYKREMLEKNNITWPEGVFCEDKLFTIQALYYANGIVTVPNIYYYYFRNPNSTVNSRKKRHTAKIKIDKNDARKAVVKFLREKNAQIRDKEFWAIIDEYKKFKLSWWQKRISLNTLQILFLGVPILTIENKNNYRIQNFLFNLIKTKKTNTDIKEEKIFNFCGINFSKRIIENDVCEYYFLGILIKKFHLADFLYKKYLKQIKYDYDDIYLLNSNSGELYLFFAFICRSFLEKNNSKKPLFIATKKYHVDLLKMYYPDANYIFINNTNFKTQSNKWTKNGHNIYLIFSGNYFEKVEFEIKNNKSGFTHYLDNILLNLNLKKEDCKFIKPQISEKIINSVNQKIQQLQLKDDNFIILAPEAITCEKLPLNFWNNLAQNLKELGFDLYVNITNSKNIIEGCKHSDLNLQEIFYLAQKAKAIISLRSGLSEFLVPTETPNISIYTNFKKKAISVDKILSGFSIKKHPDAFKYNIEEINAEIYNSPNKLVNEILNILNKILNKGVE